jgi:hypothetical protein
MRWTFGEAVVGMILVYVFMGETMHKYTKWNGEGARESELGRGWK